MSTKVFVGFSSRTTRLHIPLTKITPASLHVDAITGLFQAVACTTPPSRGAAEALAATPPTGAATRISYVNRNTNDPTPVVLLYVEMNTPRGFFQIAQVVTEY